MPKSSVLAFLVFALLLPVPCVSAAPLANPYENPSDPNCHCSKADYNRIGPSHMPPLSPGQYYYTKPPRSSLCDLPLLKKRASYRAARVKILAKGYVPAYSNKKTTSMPCEWKDDREAVAQCRSFPEIEACSADGACAVNFRNATGDRLRVATFGPYWLRKSEVAGWDIRCAKY